MIKKNVNSYKINLDKAMTQAPSFQPAVNKEQARLFYDPYPKRFFLTWEDKL